MKNLLISILIVFSSSASARTLQERILDVAVRTTHEKRFFRWGSEASANNLLQGGVISDSIMRYFNAMGITRSTVAGGGIYMADDPYTTTGYGQVAVEFIVPAGTLYIDAEDPDVRRTMFANRVSREDVYDSGLPILVRYSGNWFVLKTNSGIRTQPYSTLAFFITMVYNLKYDYGAKEKLLRDFDRIVAFNGEQSFLDFFNRNSLKQSQDINMLRAYLVNDFTSIIPAQPNAQFWQDLDIDQLREIMFMVAPGNVVQIIDHINLSTTERLTFEDWTRFLRARSLPMATAAQVINRAPHALRQDLVRYWDRHVPFASQMMNISLIEDAERNFGDHVRNVGRACMLMFTRF